MALVKLPNGRFQAKLRGSDGLWISKVFDTRRDAEAFHTALKQNLNEGVPTTNQARAITVDEYFTEWFETVQTRASVGWRNEQRRQYVTYIQPVMGKRKLSEVSPKLVARVLNQMANLGRAEQTRLHVFGIMRKMFGDAIELFRLITFNPAQKTLKPRIPQKEAQHLNLEELRDLLLHVQDKTYGLAIWLQTYLGLRVGELQALSWEDIDLQEGVVRIRKAYSRKEQGIRDYPKGRKQHSHRIPEELLGFLRRMREHARSTLVAPSPTGQLLYYEGYVRFLRRYCKELGIRRIATHGLRHSTSELYLSYGASQDDIRQLFAHSSSVVTERYIHRKGSNLEKVAKVIRLFPECSMDVPWQGSEEVDKRSEGMLSSQIPK
jgi:integrase